MLWIISGPSSVGKSTFLASPRCREITGLGAETPVTYAFQPTSEIAHYDSLFWHYNILRPAARMARRSPAPASSRLGKLLMLFAPSLAKADTEEWQRAASDFRADARWIDLLGIPMEKRALILVADREQILRRIRERRTIEATMEAQKSNVYDSAWWEGLYARIDLPQLYRAWQAELSAAGLEPLLVESKTPDFRLLSAL